MRSFPRSARLAFGLVLLGAPAIAADMPEAYFQSRPAAPVAGQCQSYLARPVTADMLPAMHKASCCDTLDRMADSPAVWTLERRLACPNWHAYRRHFGQPPLHIDLEDLITVDSDEVHTLPPPPVVTPPPVVDPDPPLLVPDPPPADPPPDEEFTIS